MSSLHFSLTVYVIGNVRCKLMEINKAMGSTPRTILGEFLKGQLEKARVLRCPEEITTETLSAYGRNDVTLIRYTNKLLPNTDDLSNKVFVLDFSRPKLSGTRPALLQGF